MRGAVDPEAHPRNRHFEPGPGALERRLDIGGEPIELDRALHQAPDAEQGDQDQHRGERAEPAQEMMCAAPDMARCPVVQQPVAMRPRIGGGGRRRWLPLTGLGPWASVAAPAGILR